MRAKTFGLALSAWAMLVTGDQLASAYFKSVWELTRTQSDDGDAALLLLLQHLKHDLPAWSLVQIKVLVNLIRAKLRRGEVRVCL